MMNFLDRIQQKFEFLKLEKRYARRRTTFISEAQYVDGEYIYSPTSTKCSAGGSDSDEEKPGKENKGARRLSRMVLDKADWRKGPREDTRASRVDVTEVPWEEHSS